MARARDPRGHDLDPYGAAGPESPWSRHPLAALLICVIAFAALVVLYVVAF